MLLLRAGLENTLRVVVAAAVILLGAVSVATAGAVVSTASIAVRNVRGRFTGAVISGDGVGSTTTVDRRRRGRMLAPPPVGVPVVRVALRPAVVRVHHWVVARNVRVVGKRHPASMSVWARAPVHLFLGDAN